MKLVLFVTYTTYNNYNKCLKGSSSPNDLSETDAETPDRLLETCEIEEEEHEVGDVIFIDDEEEDEDE